MLAKNLLDVSISSEFDNWCSASSKRSNAQPSPFHSLCSVTGRTADSSSRFSRPADIWPGCHCQRLNITWLKRLKVACIIPVEDMTAIGFHPAQGIKNVPGPRCEVSCANETEVPRRKSRNKIQADIGRRGTMGNHPVRVFLIIVLVAANCPRDRQRFRNRARFAAATCSRKRD